MSPDHPDHHGRKDPRSRQPHARAATSRSDAPRARQAARHGRLQPIALLALVLAAVVVVVLALVARGCATDNTSGQMEAGAQQAADDQASTQPADSVSFCAVGDNLANENTLAYADSWSGITDDLSYDFGPLYDHVRDAISGYNIAFVNQETTLGVYQGHGYAGYPSYNTPDSMAQAVSDAGFDVVNTNSNHTYDTWTDSILNAQKVWASYPNITVIGSYASEQDRQNMRTVEKNGITLAFLSYSYGQNGYTQSQLPNDYYAVPWDEEAMREDMARAKEKADFVIVYLHMGTEYTNTPNEQQVEAAQACADAGAGLVLCSHAHVIQPMAWLQRSDGSGSTLVAYGLGDFVSGYHRPECVLLGMFSCDFVRNEDGSVGIQNVVWHTLIEHAEGDVDTVYLARDYTDDMASANELLADLDNPGEWIRSKTSEVIGSEFQIDQ